MNIYIYVYIYMYIYGVRSTHAYLMVAVPDSGRQYHGVSDKAPVLEHGHLHDDPHGGTRLSRARDDASTKREAAYGMSM